MSSDDQRPPLDGESLAHDGAPQNETESVERYRRAHEVIERMQADLAPDRASASDDDPEMDVTAALLRAATPHAAEVDPGFAARLLARLEAAQVAQATATAPAIPAVRAARATPPLAPASAPPADAPVAAPGSPVAARPIRLERRPQTGFSRRGLMLGGLGAAAAAVIGGAAGIAIEATNETSGAAKINPAQVALIPDGVGAWVAVAHAADVPLGAVVRFQTDAVIGYLRHGAEGFIALSGVCTHMACLLQWNGVERTFDCPCHGSRFLESGKQAPGARYAYPPLPGIKTRVDQGLVWVYVISPSGSTPDQPGPSSTSLPYNSYDH